MKKRNTKRIILAIIGICLISTVFAMFNLNVNNNFVAIDDSEDIQGVNNIITRPKTSATYNYNLTVDNAGAKNWEWAVTQAWCSGSGVSGDPYVISGHTIMFNNSDRGEYAAINISNSRDVYVRISGVTVRNNASDVGIGIALSNCTNIYIDTCNASDNGDNGIYIVNSQNITISDCMMRNNHHRGVMMDNVTISTLSNSELNHNGLSGLYLGNSTHNSFETSNFTYNGYAGAQLEDSDLNNITTSVLNYNYMAGVGLSSSDGCYITSNNVSQNTAFGVIILNNSGDSINNHIFDNTIDNIENIYPNGYDNGSLNVWDNGIDSGNYWGDYSGADLDDDGIGDTPYDIAGESGDNPQDRYPIWDDGDSIAPVVGITRPSSNQIFVYSPSFTITIVEAEGVYNRWYTINAGGTNTTFTGLSGSISHAIWATVTGLEGEILTVTLTISVNDTSGNIGTDSVVIRKAIPEKESSDRKLYKPKGYVIEQAYVTVILVALFILFKVKSYYSKLIRIR